jgi:hypothetical protein
VPLKWRRFEDTPEGQRILEERAMKTPLVIPASFSSMEAYNTCPKQFYETRILKNWKQVETPEMDWGNRVHKALEMNIKYGRELPSSMEQYQWGLQAINMRKPDSVIHAEKEVAITIDHTPTGFLDDDCWLRGKGDVVIHDPGITSALNGDWKTNAKPKPNSKQLDLSTLMCFDVFPTLEKVRTVFFWLPHKQTTQKLFVRHDSDRLTTTNDAGKMVTLTFEEMWAPFLHTIGEMEWSLKNNAWPANKSGLCAAHCPVLTCSFNGKRP